MDNIEKNPIFGDLAKHPNKDEDGLRKHQDDLYDHPKRKGKIIRKHTGTINEYDMTNQDKIGKIRVNRDLLRELEGFGINIVPSEYVLGEGTKREHAMYAVSDKVDGDCLDVIISGEVKVTRYFDRQLTELVKQLVAYLSFKYNKSRSEPTQMLWDVFGSRQFMYGTTDKTLDPRIFLTDIGPNFHKINIASIASSLTDLARMIAQAKTRINFDWTEARKDVLDLLHKVIPVPEPYLSKDVRELLNDNE